MIPVSGARAIRELDRRTIEDLGLPGIALMELAADAVVREVLALPGLAERGVAVVCGPGNNGGDGWAVARRLHRRGIGVRVVSDGPAPAGDAATMAAAARALGVPVGAEPGPTPAVWVDALFGTGLARPLDDRASARVAAMTGAPVVAVDVPSGLDADTGAVLGACVRADVTVTFQRPKLGLLLGAGPDVAGRVVVADLGLGDDLADAGILEPTDLRWPVRAPGDHKNRSGHLLIVAGSLAMAGAAILACRGALAAGVGLLTLAAPAEAVPRLAGLPPEVMLEVRDPHGLPHPSRFDAVVAGPGLGPGAPEALAGWWRELPRPALFDADALRFTGAVDGDRPRVLTPHPGEAARLLGGPVTDRLAAAERLSGRGVVVLKGRHTVVAAPGALPALNPTGNAILATGGSGDVLAGVIGALLARGLPPRDAALTGVYVHGLAADRLGRRRREGWTAGDVAAEVPAAAAEATGRGP